MDSVILEKDNSENQARQYSSHKYVANIEWWANHKKKKKKMFWLYITQFLDIMMKWLSRKSSFKNGGYINVNEGQMYTVYIAIQ